MTLEPIHILLVIVIGTGATMVMDAWAMLMKQVFNMTSLDYCFVGRWLQHFRHGVFRHQNITSADKQTSECLLGWLAHYLTGIIFAMALVLVTSGRWLLQPGISEALLFGLVTVAFPFFILQPCLGFGIAGSKTPSPVTTRMKSLAAHAAFGVGLYVCALALVKLFPGWLVS